MRRVMVLVGLTVLVIGCSKQIGLQDPPRRVPPRVSADKWFVVTVRTMGDSCDIQIHPERDEGGGEVKVKRNWNVAWFFLNTCTHAANVTPRIDFYYTPTGSEEKTEGTQRRPIRWSAQTASVLLGKVQARGDQSDCKNDASAPCGRYQYTVHVGKFSEDPDWEIVVF